MVTVQCVCGFRMQADVSHLGQHAQCGRCGATFRLWPLDETKSQGPGAVWHLRVGPTQFGPFTPADLVRFVAEGRIQRDSLVRKGDEGPWTPAALVRGLLDAPIKALPIPPPPPAAPAPTPRPPTQHGSHDPGRSRSARPGRRARAKPAGALIAGSLLAVVVIGGLMYLLATRGGDAKEKSPVAVAAAKTKGPAPAPSPAPATAPVKPPAPEVLTPQTLIARAGPSVAVLEGRSGSGSGFLVGHGLLATNRHVIDDELIENVRVRWPDGGNENTGLYGVKLVYEDPEADVALLSVETKLAELSLSLVDSYTRGQEILCIGSPGVGGGRVMNNAISRGLLGTKVTLDSQEYVQIDMAVNPGNSGGPVFDMNGKVVGIVTLKATRLDGVGFCLPVAVLRRAIDRSKSLSSTEAARTVAAHRLRVCAAALIRASRVYAAAGHVYLLAMDASARAKEDINKGLWKARNAAEDVLRQISGETNYLVREYAEKPARDDALAPKSRDTYKELRDLYQALRDHVDTPHGTLDTFRKTQEECRKNLRRIEAHFIREEGVRLPDED